MNRFIQRVQNFVFDNSGATAVEYAVLLALIAGAMIAAIVTTGDSANGFWDGNANSIQDAIQ